MEINVTGMCCIWPLYEARLRCSDSNSGEVSFINCPPRVEAVLLSWQCQVRVPGNRMQHFTFGGASNFLWDPNFYVICPGTKWRCQDCQKAHLTYLTVLLLCSLSRFSLFNLCNIVLALLSCLCWITVHFLNCIQYVNQLLKYLRQ